MKKPRLRIPFKLILALVFLVVIYLTVAALFRGLKNLDYFKIKEIAVRGGGEKENFSYFKGQGIFNIDLKKESGRIWQFHPAYKKVRLIRILPNRLLVDFVKRTPQAYVKLYRYFCVDEELVLLDAEGEPQENALPVILGLETKIFGPKIGKKYNVQELGLAVSIVREVKKRPLAPYLNIKVVNVANPVNAFFVTDNGLEVRIGQDNIRERVELLENLMRQTRNELSRIKYFDLRFKDPVIKFKEDAKQ